MRGPRRHVPTLALLLAGLLVAFLATGSAAASESDGVPQEDVGIRLNPDPPIAGRGFGVYAKLPDPGVQNATLRVCTYDRAAGEAVLCFVPAIMSPVGPGEFAGHSDDRVDRFFKAGGSVGINVSYMGFDGAIRHLPANGDEYVLFDIVEDASAAGLFPIPGVPGVFGLAAAGALAVAARRSAGRRRGGNRA